jgi:hypothetical protein
LSQGHLTIEKNENISISSMKPSNNSPINPQRKLKNNLKAKDGFLIRFKNFIKNFPYRITVGIVVVIYFLWPKPQDKKFLLEYLKHQE